MHSRYRYRQEFSQQDSGSTESRLNDEQVRLVEIEKDSYTAKEAIKRREADCLQNGEKLWQQCFRQG